MNYYNENDPKAAAWLRELIKEGCISEGVVDERSIIDVHASDLSEYRQCHFFAGIGGWSYALRLAGVPDDEPVWTGSCPCQPFSNAGLQLGTADARHLWPVFFRLIAQHNPSTVFGEQVASKAGRNWLAGVFTDLESVAYAGAGADLCAASVGAPHIRQRIYWVANARYRSGRTGNTRIDCAQESSGESHHGSFICGGTVGGLEYATSNGREQWWSESSGRRIASGCSLVGLVDPLCERRRGGESWCEDASHAWFPSQALLCTDGKTRRIEPGSFPLAHGVSGRVGLLRGYGNAIVPQVAAEFIQAFYEALHDVRSHVLTFSPK